jgi:hypothetical protein
MKKRTETFRARPLWVGVLVALALPMQAADSKLELPVVEVTNTPVLSRMVAVGTRVAISLDRDVLGHINEDRKESMSDLPLRFQWQKDGDDIPGATNSTYTINAATFYDAATYTLVLSGFAELQSAPFHLSVYILEGSHSNGGALAVPIGDFTSGSYPVCGGTGFDRYKVYFPFYGPNASPQSGAFQNTSHSSNLDVTTCTNSNGTVLDTAIRIQGNWLGTPELACNNDTNCVGNPLLSFCTMALSTNASASNTYRATLYFKSATLGSGKTVTFLWNYHN